MSQLKLSDVVSISPVYHTEVNIRGDFDHKQKIEGYLPNEASRTALASMIGGLRPNSEQRVHLLTGQYGTGKSHFGLVVAALLRKLPETAAVLDKIREKDEKRFDLIERHLNAAPHKFLVVVPNIYDYSRGFNCAILTALEEALAREEITFRPQSHFNRAIQVIDDWKKKGDRNPTDSPYEKLDRVLASSFQSSPDILKDGLRKYSAEAYRTFEKAHEEVAYGASFDPGVGADPCDIYAQTARYLRASGDWEGICLICDEFGDYLAEIAKDQNARDSLDIQSFAEFCKRTAENQVHFVVIAHQSLADYAAGTLSLENWQKIAGRFIGSEHSLTNVGNQHEIVGLMGTVLVRENRTEAEKAKWDDIRKHPDITALLDDMENSGLYAGQSREWLLDDLVIGCFPMHPMTAFCLPWMTQKIGQRERTLFSFLAGTDEEGLERFVTDAPLTLKNGKLNLYTPDMLIAYFGTAAEAKAREAHYRHIMRASREAVAAVQHSPLSKRLINTLTVFQIVGAEVLPPTEANLVASLHLAAAEAEEARRLLDELSQSRKIIRRRPNGFYELRRGEEVDLEDVLQRAKTELRHGFDPVAVLSSLEEVEEKLTPITAVSYQKKHFMTREATRRIVRTAQLSNPKQYIDMVESWYQPSRKTYAGDLLILYVLTETSDEIEQIRLYANMEAYQHPQLVIAIPKSIPKLTGLLFDLAAARRARLELARSTERHETNIEELDILIGDLGKEIHRALDLFLQADNLTWHCDGSTTNHLSEGGEEDYVSKLLENRFHATPAVRDADIINVPRARDKNKTHRQNAMNRLLGTTGYVGVQKKEGPADDRILRTCLIETELLEKREDQGAIATFEMRQDAPPNSELEAIWNFLKTNLQQESVQLGNVVRALLSPPYGLSHQLIEILLAAFFRNRTDEFVIFGNLEQAKKKHNQNLITRVELDAENITNIVSSPDNYVLSYYEVRPSQRAYVEGILSVVGLSPDPATMGIWDRGATPC